MAVFDYKDEKVRKVIEGIKFGFNRELVGLVLSGWKRPSNWEGGVVLVPVPLHRYRENWRGFNQAELVVKAVGDKKTKMVKALRRMRATIQQARIVDKRKRRENLRGCFGIEADLVGQLLGKKVILIDDVFTSGATMRECTKELKKAGVRQVWGFVLAR